MDIEDITAEVAHAPGPEDRVFRVTGPASPFSADGVYVVKVKTIHDEEVSRPGRETLRLTSSLCDADGRALRRADGEPLVHPADVAHVILSLPGGEPGAVPDIAGDIDRAQRGAAEMMLVAVANLAAVRLAPGVARSSDRALSPATRATALPHFSGA